MQLLAGLSIFAVVAFFCLAAAYAAGWHRGFDEGLSAHEQEAEVSCSSTLEAQVHRKEVAYGAYRDKTGKLKIGVMPESPYQ